MNFRGAVLLAAGLLLPSCSPANDWGCPPNCECTPNTPPQDVCPDGSAKSETPILRGVVTDSYSHLPLGGVWVRVFLGLGIYTQGYSLSDGSYEVHVSSGSSYTLEATDLFMQGRMTAKAAVEIPAGPVCPVGRNLALACADYSQQPRRKSKQFDEPWRARHLDCLIQYEKTSLEGFCQGLWAFERRILQGYATTHNAPLSCITSTFSEAGCLMTCLGNIAGRDPWEANRIQACGQNVDTTRGHLGGIMEFDRAARLLGFSAGYWMSGPGLSESTILDALKLGRYVIVRLDRPGHHHFIIVTGHGYDSGAGACAFSIEDPGSSTCQFLHEYLGGTCRQPAIPWTLGVVASVKP
jgi:hypothetical protein